MEELIIDVDGLGVVRQFEEMDPDRFRYDPVPVLVEEGIEGCLPLHIICDPGAFGGLVIDENDLVIHH